MTLRLGVRNLLPCDTVDVDLERANHSDLADTADERLRAEIILLKNELARRVWYGVEWEEAVALGREPIGETEWMRERLQRINDELRKRT